MFKYTKEFVLNRAADRVALVDGIRPDRVKEQKIVIERVGEYFPSYMSSVEETKGQKGEYATLTITPGTLEAGVYNIRINVKLHNKYLGEYAHPNYAAFGKPIMVGFEVKSGDDAVAKIYDQIYEAVRAADEFVKVEKEASAVKLTAKDFYMTFGHMEGGNLVADAEFEKYVPCGDACNPQGDYEAVDGKISVTANQEPFATGEWILENLRLPTSQNLRFGTVNDEMPIPGAMYRQFSFAYTSPRPGFGGLSGVGQRIEAVTNHVFYVLESEADAFKSALAGVTVENILPDTKEENVSNPGAGNEAAL